MKNLLFLSENMLESERDAFFKERNYECEVCHKPLRIDTGEIAHRLNNGPVNNKYFGKEIIDNPLNKGITCRGLCNSSLLVDNKKMERGKLLKNIVDSLIIENPNYVARRDVQFEIIEYLKG